MPESVGRFCLFMISIKGRFFDNPFLKNNCKKKIEHWAELLQASATAWKLGVRRTPRSADDLDLVF